MVDLQHREGRQDGEVHHGGDIHAVVRPDILCQHHTGEAQNVIELDLVALHVVFFQLNLQEVVAHAHAGLYGKIGILLYLHQHLTDGIEGAPLLFE